jgi:hypothetical protein
MIENCRAPRGDGKTQLIEREGERHPHRLVELLAFALMHDRDDKIVSFDLNLLDRASVVITAKVRIHSWRARSAASPFRP